MLGGGDSLTIKSKKPKALSSVSVSVRILFQIYSKRLRQSVFVVILFWLFTNSLEKDQRDMYHIQ
ncbi:hypothetical protein AGMMS49531_11500 [Endomicrobiia bacterium]|nr:hypothetical protein AGMMS49531_11500 [Endomicrobiia bacterium]